MSVTNVQFTVATHIMAALAFNPNGHDSLFGPGEERQRQTELRAQVALQTRQSEPDRDYARQKRRKHARPSPKQITLLDIYRASAAPAAVAIHPYPIEKRCPISANIKVCMSTVLAQAQNSFEKTLARTTLADLVADLKKKQAKVFLPLFVTIRSTL